MIEHTEQFFVCKFKDPTVSYRNKPGEGSYSVKSDAVLAWPPNKK